MTIEELYIHCGKALMRGAGWDPEIWHASRLPSHAGLVKEVEAPPHSVDELEQYDAPSCGKSLYVEKPRLRARP